MFSESYDQQLSDLFLCVFAPLDLCILVSFSVCFFAFFVFLVSVSWNFVRFNLLYKTATLSIYSVELWIWKSGQRLKTVLFFNQFMSPVSCHMKRTKANQNFLVFLRDKYNFCDTYLIIPSQIKGICLGPFGPLPHLLSIHRIRPIHTFPFSSPSGTNTTYMMASLIRGIGLPHWRSI